MYRSVISGVVRNLAATFLDCGIDDGVREELEGNWIANLEEMGSLTDYPPPLQPIHVGGRLSRTIGGVTYPDISGECKKCVYLPGTKLVGS